MGTLSFATLVILGTFAAGLTFDLGINAIQNWYDVVYQDAFWSRHPTADSAVMQELSREEREIDRLMRVQDFVTSREAR